MNPGDQLAADMIRMGSARTWSELEAICRDLDARYEVEGVQDVVRRAYEVVKTHHAKRLAATVAA